MFYEVFVFSAFVILSVIAAFTVGVLYGESGCGSIVGWVKQLVHDLKEEKAFLKAHPLCVKCQQKGLYRKSKYMWRWTYVNGISPVALCSKCMQEEAHKFADL